MSVSFRRGTRKPHLTRGTGGLAAALDTLRSDVERGFSVLEGETAGLPHIDRIESNQVNAAVLGLRGVGNTATSALTCTGTGFNAGIGRDEVRVNCAAAHADFRITALNPGDSLVDIALFDNGAETIVAQVVAGRTQIVINYNGGTSTVNTLSDLVDGDATADDLIHISREVGNNGTGVIAAAEINTVGATAVAATSAYFRLGSLVTADLVSAVTTVTGTASGGQPNNAGGMTFAYGGITTAARFAHTSDLYGQDERPSDTFLQVATVTTGGAEFTAAGLVVLNSYPFELVLDGYRAKYPLLYITD
jgi:hypothetical protein